MMGVPASWSSPPGFVEPRIRGVESADLEMDLDSAAAGGQAPGRLTPDIGLGIDRERRDDGRHPRGQFHGVVVQKPQHAGPVRVSQGGVMPDTDPGQNREPVLRRSPVCHGPRGREAIEPPPHGVLEVIGQEVHVRVNDSGDAEGGQEGGDFVISHREQVSRWAWPGRLHYLGFLC